MNKILVIDDKSDNLISIKALLNNVLPECEILTAQSGAEGLIEAINEQPDVILLDIIMPHMDGYEVIEKLKQNSSLKHIPVILLTAIKTDSKSRIKGLDIGADAFLSKPIDPAELSAQVKVMLRIKIAEDKLRREKVDLEKIVEKRTKEIKLQSLALEAAAVAIVITNQEGSILWCNPAFSKISGYHKDDLIGNNLCILKSGKHDENFYKNLWDTINSGKVWHKEIINKRKDGKFYTEQNTITPLFSKNGEIINFVAIKEDISDRKNMEIKLRHSEKMETIGNLAGGIAHDFNNMLTIIIGNTELSLNRLDNGKSIGTNLKNIMNASERAKHLVNQILTFSRQNTDVRKPVQYGF